MSKNKNHRDGLLSRWKIARCLHMGWRCLESRGNAFTVVGHPVCALPAGLDRHGLPFGLQVVGAPYEDRRLLSAARALETALATNPSTKRPVPQFDELVTLEADCRDGGIAAAEAAAR